MVATGVAILGAAAIGGIVSLGTLGVAAKAQGEAKKEKEAILKQFQADGAQKRQQLLQFMNASGLGHLSGLV